MAAHRAGCRTVILPRDNEKDLAEVPEAIQQEITIRFVDTMDEVLDVALEGKLEGRAPLAAEATAPSTGLAPAPHVNDREPLAN